MSWKKYDTKQLGDLIAKNKGRISKREIADKLQMTENGLHKAIVKESLRFNTFQDLCEILGINPCELFLSDETIDEFKDRIKTKEHNIFDKESISREYHNTIVSQLKDENTYLRKVVMMLGGSQRTNK